MDTQGAGNIATQYQENRDTGADPFESWRSANDNPNGRNAVAIEKDKRYGYFEKSEVPGVPIPTRYTWKIIPKEEW